MKRFRLTTRKRLRFRRHAGEAFARATRDAGVFPGLYRIRRLFLRFKVLTPSFRGLIVRF
jgi:hypothetical protein